MIYKIKPFGLLVFRILFLLGVLSCGRAEAGTWTQLAHNAPGNLGALLLLPDGTVMAQGYAGQSWYRLTPNSAGSYVNGTWTTLAPMHDTRLYFASEVLQDGRVFVAGGEYGSGGSTAEIYDPKTNVWTELPSSGQDFIDAMGEVLPNGNVMVIPVYSGATPYIYNPVLNTWTAGPNLNHGQDEATWIKLPDTSILTIDPGTKNSERYIPSLNKWLTDGTLPVSIFSSLGEEGAALLLPDKRAVFFGDTGNSAFYTATGGTTAGTWMAGTMLPQVTGTSGTTIQLGVPDAPMGMLTNGSLLAAFSQAGTYNGPTYFYEFNPTANSGSGSFTAEPAPGSTVAGSTRGGPAYLTTMLALPDGTLLVGEQSSSSLYEYTPSGSVVTSGTPAISIITSNTDGSYTLTGTWLNGSSEGACYGDDLQMATNYPILKLTSGTNTYFAKTYNWSNTGVATGTASETVQFRLTPSMTTGTYSTTVIASGIQSPSTNFVISNVPTGVSIALATGTTTKGSTTPASFTITRTGPTTNAMPVSFAVGGSGVQGTDFYLTDSSTNTITNSVTIPAGSASATVKIYGIDDDEAGSAVTAQLAILSGTNYEPSANAYFASVTINDSDVAPMVTITAPSTATLGTIAFGVPLTVTGTTSGGTVYSGTNPILSTMWNTISGPAAISFAAPNTLSTTASFPYAGVYNLELSGTPSLGPVITSNAWELVVPSSAVVDETFDLSGDNPGNTNSNPLDAVWTPISPETLSLVNDNSGLLTGTALEVNSGNNFGAGGLGAFTTQKLVNPGDSISLSFNFRYTSNSVYSGSFCFGLFSGTGSGIFTSAPVISGTHFSLIQQSGAAYFNGGTQTTTLSSTMNAIADTNPHTASITLTLTTGSSINVVTTVDGNILTGTQNSPTTLAFSNVGFFNGYALYKGFLIDNVQVDFLSAPNSLVVTSGTSQTTTGTNGTLNGSVAMSNAEWPITQTWSVVSGPGTVTFTNPNAAVTTAQFSALGTYVLQLTGFAGSVSNFSQTTVTVANPPPPTINVQPISRTSFAGGSLQLAVSASGATGYQWYENGNAITGATNATLSLSALTATNSGNYSAQVSNAGGSVMSGTSTVNVVTPAWWSYEQQVIANNPVAYWPLNETSGTTAFDAYGLNDGAYQGGYTLGAAAQPVPPYYGFTSGSTAALFDGSSSYVNFGTGASISGTVPFTVSAWVQTTATATQVIAQQRDGGFNGEFQLSLTANGKPNFFVYGGGADQFTITGTTTLNDGNWHHVVALRTGTNGAIYVDGALDKAGSGTLEPLVSTIGFYVGADVRDNNAYFDGKIDQVALFDTALTSAQISSIYQSAFGQTVTVVATTETTTKGDAANPGMIAVTRSGVTNNPLTINFANGGSAVLGSDYTLTSGTTPLTTSVVIPTGSASATIDVNGLDNGQAGGAVIEQMTLQSGSAYELGGSATSAAVTINDVDTNPSISLTTPTLTVINLPSGVGLVLSATANNNGGTFGDGNPTLTTNWSQTSGSGTVTFSAPNSLTTNATFSGTGTYGLSLTGSNSAGQLLPAQNITVVVLPLGQDVGATGTAGSTTLNSGTYVMTSYATAAELDNNQYASVVVSGNFTATVHQVGFSGGQSFPWSGLVVRQDLGNSNPAVAFLESPNGSDPEWRTSAGGGTSGSFSYATTHWFQIVRTGTTIAYNISTDGTTWTPYLSGTTPLTTNVTFTDPIYVGMSASSHNGGLATVTYDHFTVTGSNGVILNNIAPVVSGGTNQTITSNTTTLNGSANDDLLPNPPAAVTANWSLLSGPGNVTLGNPAALTTTAVFATSGTYTLQLTANDGAITTFNNVIYAVSIAPQTPFAAWQTQNFGANASNPAIAGDTAIPSGNGIPNLMSYALNLNPFSNSAVAQLPAVSVSGSNIILTFRQNDTATDITYTVEQSTDLKTWTPVSETPTQVSDDGSTSVMQISVPMNGQATLMLHLKVTRND